MLFNVKEEGMHLKAFSCGSWKNLYPSLSGVFAVPEDCNEVILIAMDNSVTYNSHLTATETTSSSGKNIFSKSARRGNAAGITQGHEGHVSSFFGKRSVPSFKKAASSIPIPCRRKKTEPCFKMVAVSDINLETETDSAPYTIYEVPIDLEKLGEKHGKFSIHHIQPEVAFQIGGTEYVLTNKKGNPIRDMPNTRGRL